MYLSRVLLQQFISQFCHQCCYKPEAYLQVNNDILLYVYICRLSVGLPISTLTSGSHTARRLPRRRVIRCCTVGGKHYGEYPVTLTVHSNLCPQICNLVIGQRISVVPLQTLVRETDVIWRIEPANTTTCLCVLAILVHFGPQVCNLYSGQRINSLRSPVRVLGVRQSIHQSITPFMY